MKRLGAALLAQCLFRDLVSGIPLEIPGQNLWRHSGSVDQNKSTAPQSCRYVASQCYDVGSGINSSPTVQGFQCLGKAVWVNTATKNNSLSWPILNKRNLKSLLVAVPEERAHTVESHWVLLARIESFNSTHRKSLRQTSEVWLHSYVLRSDLLTGLCNRIMAKFGGGTERWIRPHSLNDAGKPEHSCRWLTLSEPGPTVLDAPW